MIKSLNRFVKVQMWKSSGGFVINYFMLAFKVLAPREVLDEWQQRPRKLVSRYIKRYLTMKGHLSLDGQCGSMCIKSPRRFKLVQQESENYE